MFPRKQLTEHEITDYVARSQNGPCFVCQVVNDTATYKHHVIHETEHAIVFLNMTQPLCGYTLVAPKFHIEQAIADFSLNEYLEFQELVHATGLAVGRAVEMERLYVLSLGSQQGNRHVHWHIAPLPPGVPYSEQQLAALHHDAGILDMTEAEKAGIAQKIRAELKEILQDR